METFYLLLPIVFLLSVFSSIAGIGIAHILIPLFLFAGIPFVSSKALALWVNVWIMLIANIRRWKNINWFLSLSLVVSATICAFIGAKVSFHLNEKLQLFLLGVFIIISSLLVLFFKPITLFESATKRTFFYLGFILGAFGGFIGGLLGLGGGSLVNPVMLVLGLDPKTVAGASGLMVLFSSFSGWWVYYNHINFDWKEGTILSLIAVSGSLLGTYLAGKMSREKLRKFIAVFLLFVGSFLLVRSLL